jgi:hypothetical protein
MSHQFWVPPSRLSAGCINGKFQIPLLTWLQHTDNQEIAPNKYFAEGGIMKFIMRQFELHPSR